MTDINDIQNDDLISFQLIKSGIMDSSFKSMIFHGMVSYNVAILSDSEIIVKHNTLYPYFTDKDSNSNPQYYKYLMVQDTSTSKLMPIGVPWINPHTLEILTNATWHIEISSMNVKQQNYIEDIVNRLGCPFVITKK